MVGWMGNRENVFIVMYKQMVCWNDIKTETIITEKEIKMQFLGENFNETVIFMKIGLPN